MCSNKRNITPLTIIIAICLALPAAAGQGHGEYRPEEIVCEMQPGYSIDAILAEYGISVKSFQPQTGCYLLITPQGADPESLAAVIDARPDVSYCGPNFYVDAPEPFQKSQAFLDELQVGTVDSQLAALSLGIAEAHVIADGTGIKIAVIDGGVNLYHPEFAESSGNLVSAWDYIDGDTVAMDELGGACSGHGTFVAGILNLVAPASDLYVYRVLDTTGRGTGFDIASAVLRAIDDGCRVINLSMGMIGVDDALDEALKYARMEEVVVVASAGNDSTADNTLFPFPASRAYCLSVAALDSLNLKADFSNYGVKIDYCAPGTSIYAPYLGSSYAWWDGTSFAAPFVSGLAALLLSLDSTLTWENVDTIIATSATNIDSLNPGLEELLGHGLITIVPALEQVRSYLPGDANGDNTVDLSDAVYLVNYVFKDGAAPSRASAADANCDDVLNLADAVFLIAYIFHSGPPPCAR